MYEPDVEVGVDANNDDDTFNELPNHLNTNSIKVKLNSNGK